MFDQTISTALVTGASGFIGAALCRNLASRGVAVTAAARRIDAVPAAIGRRVAIDDLANPIDWASMLAGIDVVFHLAAATPGSGEDGSARDAMRYERVNVVATAHLASAAAAAGVKRLVFVSSLRAMGTASPPDRPFGLHDAAEPQDAYGCSKLAAEQALAAACRDRLDWIVLRPPLVHGPGARGNFAALVQLIASRLPLPFGLADNRRSLIARDNLVAALWHAATLPGIAGRAWPVADGPPIAMRDLLRMIKRGAGRGGPLLPVPIAALRIAGALAGRAQTLGKLLDDFALDEQPFIEATGWRPDDPVAAIESSARALARGGAATI